mgnify:CR=1 FL=1
MSPDEFRVEICNLLTARELGEVLVDFDSVEAKVASSLRHLKTCEQVLSTDPEGAVQLAYDAARKVLDASLLLVGLRVHQRGGSHGSYLKIASSKLFSQETWVDLTWMRKLRNHSEYWDESLPPISFEQASEAVMAAKAMVDDGRRALEVLRKS